eukprot:scaffold25285_cov58-Skeletonema_marinoi.AAC.1
MSSSSVCECPASAVAVAASMGLSSAVGGALAISARTSKSGYFFDKNSSIRFKSPLEIAPIGFKSAEEQSYLV